MIVSKESLFIFSQYLVIVTMGIYQQFFDHALPLFLKTFVFTAILP